MADTFNTKHGSFVAVSLITTNCTQSSSNVDLTMSVNGGCTLFVPPISGSVVAVSVRGNAEVTAGSATFRAHKDSTEYAQQGYPSAVLDTTNTLESYATINPGAMTFEAGEGVGISYSSSADLDAETIDIDATLILQLDPW